MTDTRRGKRLQFDFIDGLRAVAALVVALFHAFLFTGHDKQAQQTYSPLARLMLNGHYAVPVFIVLSGFVLMLPVAQGHGLTLRDGSAGFLKRRARRILPPYYFALSVYLLVIGCIPFLRDPQGTAWAGKVPVTVGGILSHLFLVHNLVGRWHDQIDGPMWSVATEVQIYLLMPLVLLPLWRRVGGAATVAAGVLVGWATHAIAPSLDGVHVWYVGLFAMGMLAAEWLVTDRRLARAGLLASSGAIVLLVALIGAHYQLDRNDWLTEVVVGLVFTAALLALGQQVGDGRAGRLVVVLQSRPLVAFGLFSYSFYLFHSPMLAFGNLAMLHVTMPFAVRLLLMWLVFVPVAVAVSYAAHLLVERRFLTTHQRAMEQGAEAVATTARAGAADGR